MITSNQNILCSILFVTNVSSSSGDDSSQSECGVAFLGKCICETTIYDHQPRYVDNCTNGIFQNTTVLEKMPQDVGVLIFTGNYLHTLQWYDQRVSTIPHYRHEQQHIREIRGKAFHHVQQVERLILDHNNISISPTDGELSHLHPRIFSNFNNLRALHLTNAFFFTDFTSPALSKDLYTIFVRSNLTKLIKLHLKQNEIEYFKDRNVFCELPQLMDLHLGDNILKEINFNITCLRHLRFLDLEHNQFETLNQHDMDALTQLNNLPNRTDELMVDFIQNPFQCDCSIFELVKWLKTTNVLIHNRNGLSYHRSEDYTEPMLALAFRNCTVRSMHHTTNSGHQVTLVFLLVTLLFMVGLIEALVRVSKDRIKHFVSPVVSLRKVQYSTIRDNEIAQEVHL